MLRGLAFVAVLAATGAAASAAAVDPWRSLHRPLHVPRLAPGTPCPVATVDPAVDFEAFGIGPGVGPGPAYPVGLDVRDGSLTLTPARAFRSARWMGQKVLWFVSPEYRGPLLIRGRQLDGPYRVRFDRGAVPALELRIAPNESVSWSGQPFGARGRPSYTRIRASGCYGFQVDGTDFSTAIVFRAAPRGS